MYYGGMRSLLQSEKEEAANDGMHNRKQRADHRKNVLDSLSYGKRYRNTGFMVQSGLREGRRSWSCVSTLL